MNKTVICLIRFPERRAAGHVDALLQAFAACGARAVRVDAAGLEAALSAAEGDEVLLLDDSLLGPLAPLPAFFARTDALRAPWWRLAEGVALVGLRENLWRRAGVAQAFCAGLPQLAALLGAGAAAYAAADALALAQAGSPVVPHAPLHSGESGAGMALYRWLLAHAPDQISPLWDFLLANFHADDLYRSLNLCYVLPSAGADRAAAARVARERGVLLIMHLFYDDQLAAACAYAGHFPREADVCVTTDSAEKAQRIRALFAPLGFRCLTVRAVGNRGRDAAGLLLGAADLLDGHACACFYHDKKTLQTRPGAIGAGFAAKCAENLLGTADYVANVLALFESHPRLGLLSPPPPHHADYFFTFGLDWGPNYAVTRALAEKLGLRAPMAETHAPMAPLGHCFWFRPAALRRLTAAGWRAEDFPPEPLPSDGTLLHAIERVHPFVAADAGYYAAYALSDRWAKVELSALGYYAEGFGRAKEGVRFFL